MVQKDLMCEEIRCEHLVQDEWIDFPPQRLPVPGREGF